jgi:hypothetical protein
MRWRFVDTRIGVLGSGVWNWRAGVLEICFGVLESEIFLGIGIVFIESAVMFYHNSTLYPTSKTLPCNCVLHQMM